MISSPGCSITIVYVMIGHIILDIFERIVVSVSLVAETLALSLEIDIV